MPPLESSGPTRPTHLSSAIIPDLSDKIVRPDNQYCAAGGFGDVFRCQYVSDDGVKEVAVKAFRFSFSVDEDKQDEGQAARMIRRELGIWKRLHHYNIVPFLGIAYGFGRLGSASLVSIWMPHGTLHTFLEAHDDRLGVAHRLQLLLDIANGLQYLHSFPMIHGDLTSNNVLLDHNCNACLTDFGCASLVGELPEGFTYLKMSTLRPGTLRWAAPEHFSLNEEETRSTIKSDIYSFGNMALLVLTGKYPWSEVRTDAAVVFRLSQGLKPGRPLTRMVGDRHWSLIEHCWSSIPERPLAEEVVSSLRQLTGASTPLPPLRELLGVSTLSPSVPNHLNNGNQHSSLSEDTCGHAEEVPKVEYPSGGGTTLKHMHHSEDTPSIPNKGVTDAPSDGPPMITKWIRGGLLGQGTYGCVHLALNASNGEMFAVKQVEKRNEDIQCLNFVHELKMEREILSGLHHPHIVAYLGSEETTTGLSIFLEYVPGGSIETCLLEHGGFNEDVIKSFTSQILDGLAYLHANRIIHRNIEAGNILVDGSGICKLSGFGNAQCVGDNHGMGAPMRSTMSCTAPEVRSSGGERYGPKVDIWSAGCVLLMMWAGEKRWWDGDVVALVVKDTNRGAFPSLPPDVILSDLAVDFRDRCFDIDPEARASATELLQHPYLTLHPDWIFTGFK